MRTTIGMQLRSPPDNWCPSDADLQGQVTTTSRLIHFCFAEVIHEMDVSMSVASFLMSDACPDRMCQNEAVA